MMNRFTFTILFIGITIVSAVYAEENASSTQAVDENPSITELKNKINERNNAILVLEAEISAYQKEIEKTGKEKQTLSSTINSLDLERKKLLSQIKVTEAKITQTNLKLKEISLSITDEETRINGRLDAIRDSLKTLVEKSHESPITALLGYKTISDGWEEIDALHTFEATLNEDLTRIRLYKEALTNRKTDTDTERKKLSNLKNYLADQKQIVDENAKEKNKILVATKNKEATFKRIVDEKFKLRDAFAKELLDFESDLKFEIDRQSIPTAGSHILSWPTDNPLITQEFGETDFASEHKGLYSGIGHNGIDLRASVGAPIKASANGVVKGTGNTDTVCPGASYGKWVFIDHPNGLSTLYAHLSVIKTEVGNTVSKGELIGYAGRTGYATGPHLHFTVYATQGVKILTRKSKVCGGSYTMPFADLKAYLNPMDYL